MSAPGSQSQRMEAEDGPIQRSLNLPIEIAEMARRASSATLCCRRLSSCRNGAAIASKPTVTI